jgi:hypothetical protein
VFCIPQGITDHQPPRRRYSTTLLFKKEVFIDKDENGGCSRTINAIHFNTFTFTAHILSHPIITFKLEA